MHPAIRRLALVLTTFVSVAGAVVAVCAQALQSDVRPPAAEVTVRIIVVGSEDEAQRVVDRLTKGENFVALAQEVSIDPTADTGGLLGKVEVSSLRPELRTALQGLSAGQLTGVVRIPTGFAVLKVVSDAEAGGGTSGSPGMNPAVAATGSVKYVPDVSGFQESYASFNPAKQQADWNQNPRTICEVRTQSRDSVQRALTTSLSPGNATGAALEAFDRAQGHFVLGQLHAYDGEMEQAIEEFLKAYRIAVVDVPDAALQMGEALGIAYLHKAGLDNGLHQHAPGDRCLLFADSRQALANVTDVERAIEYFSKYLAERPGELEVRWLLNLAHMAHGSYPDKVPPAQLIPLRAFQSEEDVGRFVDVAPRSGLSSVASAGGVIVDDFDNDGRLDIVTSSINSCEAMRYFRRDEKGLFVDRSSQAGLTDQLGGLNILQTDYNNDGHLDVLVLRGGWEMAQRKSLLRNDGNGTFTDVTAASGLAKPATRTQTAVWTDIDNDGFLDLFVGNEDGPAQLFQNKRDGTFVDIAERAGVDRSAFSKGVGAVDFDNDGWPDLYVSNLGGTNFLYRNNRDGTFKEMAKAAGVPGPDIGFATWFFDYDNDGWQDLFVTSYYMSVDETARTYLGLPHNANTLKLYRNLGDGGFEDVTRSVGLDRVFMPMGANYGDIDNDGFLDIYLGTGNPSYGSLLPSVLLRNGDGKVFRDVTHSSGTGELHKGHGVAFADLDHDGDEEIVFEVGGATPGDAHALRLFENPGHGHDWINLKLVGEKTNRAAIGARIAVTVENAGGTKRVIHRVVGSGGSFGASPLQQHIGLGKAARIVAVEIWWPTSNTRQRFADVPTNQSLQITEFAQRYTRLERPPMPLGGSKGSEEARAR